MTASLLHEDALNQLASGAAVTQANTRRGRDLAQRLFELCYEELLRITVFAPPAIFGLEPLLGLIEQDKPGLKLDSSTPCSGRGARQVDK